MPSARTAVSIPYPTIDQRYAMLANCTQVARSFNLRFLNHGRGLGRRRWLGMHVRTLAWILAMRWWTFHDLNFEFYRQLLGRIAGCIVTGLVSQFPVNHVFSRNNSCQRADLDFQRERSRIDA